MTPRSQQWFNLEEQLITCERCGQFVSYIGDKIYCVSCGLVEDDVVEMEGEE